MTKKQYLYLILIFTPFITTVSIFLCLLFKFLLKKYLFILLAHFFLGLFVFYIVICSSLSFWRLIFGLRCSWRGGRWIRRFSCTHTHRPMMAENEREHVQRPSLSDFLVDFVHGAFCHVGILNFYLVKLIHIFLDRLCFLCST